MIVNATPYRDKILGLSAAPTTSTVADFIGQTALDLTNNQAYVCVNWSGSTYTWKQTTASGGSTPITGTTNPTTSTAGTLGQMYLNTTTQIMYVCTKATSPYTWKPITFESAESQVG